MTSTLEQLRRRVTRCTAIAALALATGLVPPVAALAQTPPTQTGAAPTADTGSSLDEPGRCF